MVVSHQANGMTIKRVMARIVRARGVNVLDRSWR